MQWNFYLMEQAVNNAMDSLGTLMVYRYELDAVVVKLESAQRSNTILYSRKKNSSKVQVTMS